MKNVKRIEMAAGFLCCLLGILFIGIGGKNNYRAKKIVNNGVRVQAIILERDVQRRIPVPGQHMKYVSMVKFSVGEQERIGKAVSSHAVFRGDYVNIYYLPDSTDEVEDVVIEGEIGLYGPGSNQIDCGIFFLGAGIIFFLYVKGRKRVRE